MQWWISWEAWRLPAPSLLAPPRSGDVCTFTKSTWQLGGIPNVFPALPGADSAC